MELQLRKNLEACALEFGRLTGREPSTVAQLATGDWRFFDRLNEGASFTVRRYDRILSWFQANWPEGEPWPLEAAELGGAQVGHRGASAGDPSTLTVPAAFGAENPPQNISRTGAAV